jgi:hypothetical protein
VSVRGELTIQGATFKAHRERMMSGAFVIEHSGRRYPLRAKSALPREWTVPARVFIIWLAVMLWKSSEH